MSAVNIPHRPAVSQREQKQLSEGLPHRPVPYKPKSGADSMEMKRKETCQKFLHRNCTYGNRCHRRHDVGDRVAPPPARPPPPHSALSPVCSPPTSSSPPLVAGLPPHVTPPSFSSLPPPPPSLPPRPPPEVSLSPLRISPPTEASSSSAVSASSLAPMIPATAVRLVNGVYTNRFNQSLPLHTDVAQNISSEIPPVMERFEERPLATHPHPHDSEISNSWPDNASIGDAPLAGEDRRPARRTTQLCWKFQRGVCSNGDRCYRTHMYELPMQTFALLTPRDKKPTTNNTPASQPVTDRKGAELCKLNLVGKCPKGDSCHYSHDVEHPTPRVPSPVPSPRPSSGPNDREGENTSQVPNTAEDGDSAQTSKGQKNSSSFFVLPGDVCRLYTRRACVYRPCRYRHCSPEEIKALRDEHLHNNVPVASEHTADPAPDADRTAEMQAPPEEQSPSHMDDLNTGSDISGPSNGTKKRHKGRKKKGEKGKGVDASGGEATQTERSSGVGRGDGRENGDDEKLSGHGDASLSSGGKGCSKVEKGKEKGKGKDIAIDGGGQRQAKKAKAGPKEQKGKQRQNQLSIAKPKVAGPSEEAESDGKGETPRPSPTPGRPKPSSEASASQSNRLGPSRISPNAPSSLQNGDDTDYEDTDTSYYSVLESGAVSAQTSLSSIESSAASNVQAKEPCFDYIRGRCVRTHCRYSHDVQQEAGSSSSQLVNRADRRASVINAIHRANRDKSRGSSSHIPASSSMKPSVVPEQSCQPLVPPGLGLEGAVSHGQLSQPRRDPEEAVTITILDSIKILLGDVPTTVVPVEITAALQRFGEVVSVLPAESHDEAASAYRVTFARADAAADAAAALDGENLFGTEVTARVTAKKSTGIGGGTLYDGDVLFELPTARQKGYAGYATEEQAEKAITLAHKKDFKGMRIRAEIYAGIPAVGNFNVRFHNLPPDVTRKDLARYGQYEDCMLDRPKYPSVGSAIAGLRRMLSNHGEASLNVLPPPYGKYIRVWAHFDDEKAAASACEALHRFCPAFVGKQRIFAFHVKSLRYNLPSDVFDTLAYDINLLRSYIQDDEGTSISVMDRRQTLGPGAPVLIKLISRSMPQLTKLKVAYERLLRGEKVTENGQIVWNDFFGGRAGTEFLDELEKMYPKVRINKDPHRRTLALFGPEEERLRVRWEIVARANLLRAQRKQRYPVPGHLVGVFMSSDLVRLQKELGNENVWFDLTNKQLVVCGDEDTQKIAKLAVEHAGRHRPARDSGDDVGCPVCFGSPSQPVTLLCGHTWCRTCLTGYMNASVDTKSFPFTCLGDDAKCSHPIPLSVAKRLLSTNEFDEVANASFLAYVHSHPNEFHYCPTPDCPQVYQKTKRKTVLQCPSCLVRICPHCNSEYHESKSCLDQNPEDVLLFEEWKKSHDVKDCPNCKVPIERMAGCNHMTCAKCRIHICWACLALFSNGQEVYEHMRSTHGGIGL